jgi:hypothetical protein
MTPLPSSNCQARPNIWGQWEFSPLIFASCINPIGDSGDLLPITLGTYINPIAIRRQISPTLFVNVQTGLENKKTDNLNSIFPIEGEDELSKSSWKFLNGLLPLFDPICD